MTNELEDSLARLCDRQQIKIKELVAENKMLLTALKGIEAKLCSDDFTPETEAVRDAILKAEAPR